MLKQFDGRCCDAGHDETLDYRSWANFFSLDAIADIGLSKRLGFLDSGSDRCLAMRMDGTNFYANYRECLYANSRANSVLGQTYRYYRQAVSLSKWLSPYFRKLWKLNDGWEGIVLQLTTERLRRYEAGEKLDDFFEALMLSLIHI